MIRDYMVSIGDSLGFFLYSRNCSRCVFALVGVCLVASDVAIAEERNSQLLAGAAQIDITPTQFPVDSAGSMTPRTVSGAIDPLSARCLVIDDGQNLVALVLCDSCMIPREVMDAAKMRVAEQIDMPVDRILCSATHTHSAVTVARTFQSQPDQQYVEFLIGKIVDVVHRAYAARQPAQIGWAVGRNARQVYNRRWHMRSSVALTDPFGQNDAVQMNPPRGHQSLLQPAGSIDPQIAILAVQALDGEPIAVWANYSLHYVGGVPANTLSADYFGEFSRCLADKISPKGIGTPIVAMSNGTSGDINNINFYEQSLRQAPMEQIRVVAQDVASSAFAAYQRVEYSADMSVDMLQTELKLDVRRPSNAEVAKARQLLRTAGPGPWRARTLIYASETLDLDRYPDEVTVVLQAIRIGDLAIVSSPCETFVETGLALKRESPFRPTFCIELANGYSGYLPSAEQHRLGGYETWRAKSSFLAVESERLVRQRLLDMLEQLSGQYSAEER